MEVVVPLQLDVKKEYKISESYDDLTTRTLSRFQSMCSMFKYPRVKELSPFHRVLR